MSRSIALENGDLPITSRSVRGVDLVAQKIEIRLRTFRGEWPLDISAGLDFIGYSDFTTFPARRVEDDVRTELRGVAGVAGVSRVDVELTADTVDIQATLELEGEGAFELEAQLARFDGSERASRFLLLPTAGVL